MQFDFVDLGLFRHVVEAGSITKGAERANLALAAASTRIRNMELSFGTPLLIRSRHGVTPTEAGRTLLARARTILADSQSLREELGAYKEGVIGQVRLFSNTNALTEFLPEVLSAFLEAHPHIGVDLEERLSDEIVGLLARGVGDVGIVSGMVDTGALVTYPFRRDRFVVVTGEGHPLQDRLDISFAEVLSYEFVGLDRSSAIQRFLAEKASRIGRPLKLRVQLRSFDAVCRMVERNVGLGIVPETTAQRAQAAMKIAALDLSDAWATRDLLICVRDEAALPPYARLLVEHLRLSAAAGGAEPQRPVADQPA